MFVGNYLFLLGFLICWCLNVHSTISWSFVFLQDQSKSPFLFIYLNLLFLPWWVLLKLCPLCLPFQKTLLLVSLIFLIFLLFLVSILALFFFLPYIFFRLSLLFFPVSWSIKLAYLKSLLFFFNVALLKFLVKSSLLELLLVYHLSFSCYISIFICPKIVFDCSFDFFIEYLAVQYYVV